MKGEKATSEERQSKDFKWAVWSLRLEILQEWKEMQLEKLFSSLQSEVTSALKKLKCSVRLSSNTSVSKRRPFKWTHWVLFKRASDRG